MAENSIFPDEGHLKIESLKAEVAKRDATIRELKNEVDQVSN